MKGVQLLQLYKITRPMTLTAFRFLFKESYSNLIGGRGRGTSLQPNCGKGGDLVLKMCGIFPDLNKLLTSCYVILIYIVNNVVYKSTYVTYILWTMH